jgi:3-oxoacyl-[acyl-carrier-protein] synthase II
MKQRVVVTGLGVISSVGIGWRKFWDSLLAGRSGISKIRYVGTAAYPTQYGGEVHDFDPLQFMPVAEARRLGRGAQMAIAATKLALEDAKWGWDELSLLRVGVCLGTTMADIQALEDADSTWVKQGEERIRPSRAMQYPSCTMSANVARHFGLTGPNLMIPNACAAGNYAIGYAYDLLRLGRAEVMVAGGADPFSRIAFTGFNRIFAVAPEKCQPFDKNRQGTLIGEGAGVLVLESYKRAKERGATIYAEILGYGLSCDARHMTIPDPDGLARVMRRALNDANLLAEKVDYVSAHGTGTPANDKAECIAIHQVFGSRVSTLPVSSIKSMLGHTMGAASALEAISCSLAIKCGYVPPTINFETPDSECQIDCVANVPREVCVSIALNNSFAFGGNNAGLILSDVKATT